MGKATAKTSVEYRCAYCNWIGRRSIKQRSSWRCPSCQRARPRVVPDTMQGEQTLADGASVERDTFLTHADGAPTLAQHETPCGDCPFRRASIPGWLGGMTPAMYLDLAHSDAIVECHVLHEQQCAGAAIYRANVGKKPRPGQRLALALAPDRASVFATRAEFAAHHERAPVDDDDDSELFSEK